MPWSFTLTVNAHGQATLTATDQALGCNYVVAESKIQDLSLGSTAMGAAMHRDFAHSFNSFASHNNPNWKHLFEDYLSLAIDTLWNALPSPDTFDEEGRPIRR